MLEEAGVTFFFDFSDGTQLTLTDAPHERDATHELMFTDELVAGDPRGVAMGVTLRRQTRPGAYAVGDWDFLRGHAQQPRFDADDGLEHETQNERFHYLPGALRYEVGPPEGTPVADARGAMRVHERTGNELVARRLAAVRADAMTCAFSTNDHAVAPGSLVQILDHPHELFGGDRRFLVVTSRLEGRANETWRHVCEGCDASVPYRPPLTVPRPRTRGLMTATVTGPAGEEIYPDEHGRVLVKFHWDRRGALDETSSYWVHVSQAWAGAGYGMLNLPRIGQEVLIDFLHGDPDQPLVVGRVHTGVQTPPYPLPEKKALSVWKSCSTPGGDGFNEITLDDTAGAERIYMHAQFDKIVEVEHDTKEQVKRDSSSSVGRNAASTVDVDRSEKTGGNRTTSVDGNNDEVIGGNETVGIGGTQALTVGGTRDVGVGGAHTVTVGPETYTVNGSQSVSVSAAKAETVGAVCTLGVGASYAVNVGAAMTVAAGASYTLATPTATISAPTYGVKCSSGKIEGADLSVIASGSLTLQGSEVTITGGTITMGDGTINIKGGTVNVNGGTTNVAGGTTNITGGSVNVN
ncbi:MAG: type VI secretion system tip protein TssI/VgrG, partial [Myxococcota bacterium]